MKLKVIISGGGTGGHIYPAIAVAQALERKLKGEVTFLFVGAKDRMEMEKVPRAGYDIEGLWISGLQRSLSAKNLLFPVKVVSSVWKSLQIISRFKPDVAIGFGGYASGAMMYAATLRNIPCMIHEQNSFAGITNKILKNRVKKIAVAYDGMERFFPSNRIIKTGNPVRSDIANLGSKRSSAVNHFGLDPNRKTLLVIGGSLGARTINRCMEAALNQIKDAGYNLIWQTGKSYVNTISNPGFPCYISEFIYEMDMAYAAADLVISRAGALSIAELAVAGKATILVPSPNVSEDHQTSNARALSDVGAALLVKDVEADRLLVDKALKTMSDDNLMEQLQHSIHRMAIPDAADRIADELLSLIPKA